MICMDDVCGVLVCMMSVGDLYACFSGACMHDVCGGFVCMMCMGDLYA